MWFGKYLVEKNVISAKALIDVMADCFERHTAIGQLTIKHKILTLSKVIQVLNAQAIDPRPFGQIAIEMGFMTKEQLHRLIGLQQCEDPSWQDELVRSEVLTEEQLKRHLQEWRVSSLTPIAPAAESYIYSCPPQSAPAE